MRKRTAMLVAMTVILGGCGERSISDSGYPGDNRYDNSAARYRGEIDDFALLVPEGCEQISEQQIATALKDHHQVKAEIGKPLLVVQSGAVAPDGEMLTALQQHFPVIPFNGQPPQEGESKTAATTTPTSYSKRLRLAAAEGGAAHILVYWGVLETAPRNQPTALISWVPIVGWVVPDESQQMRIRLKAALIDTASGQWQMLTPAPISDDSLSSLLTRRSSDQEQVALLKRDGYQALVQQIAATAN